MAASTYGAAPGGRSRANSFPAGSPSAVRRAGLLLAATACAGALAACSRDAGREPARPLAELLPLAETLLETTTLELGDPRSEALLLDGWSFGGVRAGRKFAWAVQRRAVLRIDIVEPRPLALRLEGRPHQFPGAPPQTVDVKLNGHPIARLELILDWRPRRFRIELPPELQVIGGNHLELEHAYSARPVDVAVASGDRRSLAAAWSGFAVRGTRPAKPPRLAGTDLLLPLRTAVSLALPPTAGGELTIESVSAWRGEHRGLRGPGLPALEVSIERADGEASQRRRIETEGAEPWVVPLPATEAPLRLTLAAVAGGTKAKAASGLRLRAPTIRLEPRPSPAAGRRARTAPRPAAHPNVLVYLIDTLRADHLGCYGYGRNTSPAIDRLAAEGVLFTAAEAQSSWTRPAVASLFTGLNPQVHDTNDRQDALPAEARLMAEIFRDLGYSTAAVSTNRNVSRDFGFDRGFDSFVSLPERRESAEFHQLSDRVNEAALAWLDGRTDDSAFFLYLHSSDPHLPYAPRSPYRERFAELVAAELPTDTKRIVDALSSGELEPSEDLRQALVALYDAEIAFNDAAFGALLEELRRRDLYDSTLIVLLADHGEEFRDHGRWTHGRTLYAEQLRVPLIVKLPGGSVGPTGKVGGRRVSEVVRQIDLLPTLLDYLRADVPAAVQGRSLLPWLIGSAPPSDPVPSHAFLDLDRRGLRSIRLGQRKLIHSGVLDRARPNHELFDLAADPGETLNVAYEETVWTSYLRSLLESSRFWPRLAATDVELEGELRETLKALGYLQ